MTDTTCDWGRCPGYPEDDDEDMHVDDSGAYHPECHDALAHEEAAFFLKQFYGDRRVQRVGEVLDEEFGSGYDLDDPKHPTWADRMASAGDTLRKQEREAR